MTGIPGHVAGICGHDETEYAPTRTAYYVLDLFCRALAKDGSGRSVSDILALVKAAHGF